jgi:hypothetical protein
LPVRFGLIFAHFGELHFLVLMAVGGAHSATREGLRRRS